jgi:hypothetical protein
MGWWVAGFGEWCVAGVGEGEVGPCLDWDTPVGIVVNLAWWIGMAAAVVMPSALSAPFFDDSLSMRKNSGAS